MELRQMATAFICHGNKVLMIRKAGSRLHDSEFWAGVGGHLEAGELNAPRRACVREIYEETGIEEKDLEQLTLRYILFRIKGDEIRQQFVYFARVNRQDFRESEEGALHWVNEEELHTLPISAVVRFMLEHYLQYRGHPNVMVGTLTCGVVGEPRMQWSELRDPNIF